jgi:hypothetical protein
VRPERSTGGQMLTMTNFSRIFWIPWIDGMLPSSHQTWHSWPVVWVAL